MDFPLLSILLALLLSGHGLRKRSLSPSGALAALVVGFLMMTGGTYMFGVTLIGFYLAGSRATKYGKKKKAKLEDGYHEAGYRSGWQVLCNSASALVASFLWNAAFAPTSVQAAITRVLGVDVGRSIMHLKEPITYDISEKGWCPTSSTLGNGWSRMLVFASLGHFACCLGDTLASELGILSRSRPRLITTLRAVPPGTNGAMSVGGTLASLAGGGFVGVLTAMTLVSENVKCSEEWGSVLLETVGWGVCAGGVGSLIDSVLGATIQQTRYSKKTQVVLQDDSKSNRDDEIDVISGWNILTNNQVNLISSIACAVILCRIV